MIVFLEIALQSKQHLHLLKQYIILKELSERFVFCKSSSSGLLVLLFLKSISYHQEGVIFGVYI